MEPWPSADTYEGIAEAAFVELYPQLRRFAAVVASQDVDPDDLVQEALAHALRRGTFASLEHPAAYLRQTILNLERSHRRRWARWREREHRVAVTADAEEHYPSDLSVLQHVTPADRALLYLSLVEGLPYRTVAEVLGLKESESALRGRASRALRRLKNILEEEARDER